MSLLIKITDEVINLVPSSSAYDFKIFPIEGTLPKITEFEHKSSYVKLFCVNDLTEREKDNLHFIIPFFSFEFITSKHPEFSIYKDIKDNFI